MYTRTLRILVALDGTPAAETILAALMPLARITPVELHLLKVAPDPQEVEASRSYLSRVTGALELHQIRAVAEVETGEPGPVISARLRNGGFEFGAMTTHGRQGIKRVLMGSVAESVVRSADVPLLINRPDARIGNWKKIVVPLDGSPLAEGILEDAEILARMTGATLHLISVAGALMTAAPGMEYAISAVTVPDMKPYLHSVRKRLTGRGLKVEMAALMGPPAHSIIRHAADIGAGLIALTTHGRGGLGRVLMGSVAEQVLRTAPCPILIQPVGKAAKVGPVKA